ncbi:MAG: cation diffusion facilitator family transporter [Phycisphaerae bacterium]|nr:cation diffusion facilitator family transporter [Phycisphaerae bacterium]MDD5381642.1 cation diffusion facilitator family transporter [Phycisphaerae bacterium]
MDADKQQLASKQLRRVTYLSIAANFFLVGGKFIVGSITGSLSLLADAVHSVSDMLTDIAVLLGLYFGSKEPDSEHPYGHGKLETLSAIAIALGLLGVGLGMIYYAALDIAKGHVTRPSNMVLAAAVIAIVIKEVVYRVTKAAAMKYHCPAALANAWHDRADALSSVAVIAGVVAQKFGFGHGDQVAAIGIGVMVVIVATGLIGDCLGELIEKAVDKATIEQIEGIIKANGQIRQYHQLRTRTIGRQVSLDVHILVDPHLHIAAAHGIADSLEKALTEQITRPVNITIHVEPDTPELRKSV